MSTAEQAQPKIRGSQAVRTALIEATASLLAEVGPRSLSVREVAKRAGVNHGQIHHYFGGKKGLLTAAMRHLAQGHYDHALVLAGDDPMPPPLSLAQDTQYWRALSHSIVDGHLDLARIETDEGISVPGRVFERLKEHNPQIDPLTLKAEFTANAAMQLGWVAFEEFMFQIADVEPEEREPLREAVKKYIQKSMGHRFS